ncbi:MAG: hypothetical protein LC130_05490 [Bryobacterales bacterium]|nr:hypothetical protein [Bryobacterales bacterium]
MKNVDYEKTVSETWRHYDLAAGQDYMNLVRYATLAASSHNTQPWKFRLERGRIVILPDFSRRCPAVDPDDHHLYASLGCAAENLLLAAQAAGLRGHCSWDPSSSSVQVGLEHATPAGSALFDAIPWRQCSRSEYDGTALPGEQLGLLEEIGQGSGVSLILLTARQQKEQVAEYVAQGNTAQFGDPRWARELRRWIRFNARDAVGTGDGLFGPVMGSPEVPRWLGDLFMRTAFSARRQNRKDIAHIRSSAGIAVFISEVDDRPHWIEAGRCYERLALQAAALGLRTAFINQPVEVPALRRQFAAFLGIGNRRPDLVVRFGRGPEMPRSLRRPVEQILA